MKRKNILNSFSNKEIAQIVIEELEKAGVKYSFGPGGVQFSGFQSTDGKATYYKKKYHFTRRKSLTFLEEDELCGDWNGKSRDENDLSFVAA